MHKVIHSDAVKAALEQRGWTQKELATQLSVTGQAVTNWFNGKDFPRPDKLLKLAVLLQLEFSQLVKQSSASLAAQPIIAFRKKGGAKTTDAHILNAMAMGALLKPLVPFLPEPPALRLQLAAHRTDYEHLQSLVMQVRTTRLGVSARAVLGYEHLIREFQANGAVVIPVLWGEKKNHKNALHILLPAEKVTFIFLNLDTRLEDFKFWMAHELAHVYTPELAGQDAGEDFADAFAGALLFPRELASLAYKDLALCTTSEAQISVLQRFAVEHSISLNSVFLQVQGYVQACGLPSLLCSTIAVHSARSVMRGALVSETLFKPLPAAPAVYITAAQNIFKSEFFAALQRMIKTQDTGAGYVQQVMDIPLLDAIALHAELAR